MIRRPPRSTLSSSSAASDVYKRQDLSRLISFVLCLSKLANSIFCVIHRWGRPIVLSEGQDNQKLKRVGEGLRSRVTLTRDVAYKQSANSSQFIPVSYTHLRAHET